MKKILSFLGYDESMEYNNKILYLMILCSILVAGFYLGFYFVFLPFLPAIIVHIIYISFSCSLYYFLKKRKYAFVKISMITAHFIQLTLAVYLWFPVNTGYNLYYFMIPMVAFLILDYGKKWQLIVAITYSVVSTMFYFFSELLVMNYYYYETSEAVNRFLGSTAVINIFFPMIYIFATFAQDLNRSHKQLHLYANTDFLTQTYNRRVLFERGEEAINGAIKSNQMFSLVIFDIDFFKKVNDHYGHPVGDELLKQLAMLVKENVRSIDTFSRYGGEEFAILFRDIHCNEANEIATRLLTKIREKEFFIDGYAISITVSIGLVHYEGGFMDFEKMIQAADNALYEAKNSGRNQIVIDDGLR